MNLIDGNIPVWGKPDEGAVTQIRVCAKTADRVAMMADHHKGYAVPIGGVVAYRDKISPSGVGFDIGCGNKAVRLENIEAKYVRENIQVIMDQVWKTISFGIGRINNESVTSEVIDTNYPGWDTEACKPLRHMAQQQLGTVGSGNHYVDIFVDEKERVWIGVHFGSRGLGHKTATWFLNAAGAKDGMDVEPCVLDVNSDLGAQYLDAMTLAGRYAYAGRDWVCERVAKILGGTIAEEIHNHHNFAWHEQHDGELLWVVRKGATPAFPGQKGFVGGTMGEMSVILEGVDHPDAKLSMYSTVHGAGRVMGRREAAGAWKISRRWKCQDYRNCSYTAAKGGYFKEDGGPTPKCPLCGHKLRLEEMKEQKKVGKVSKEMMQKWLTDSNVELRGAGLDESPDCYKRLTEVLAAHSGQIKILHTLTPIGVAMAGEEEYDPYKD